MRLCVPYTNQREVEEVAKVLSSGYLTQGDKTTEFEQKVSRLVESRFASAMSSCTTALHLSLVALGIGPGDEVLVPDFTFPATANVVVQQGARPILVDVCTDTYNVKTDDLEQYITPDVRAIIPVHAFGLSSDMNAVMSFAQQYNLFVIEDAACALSAQYHGKACGSIGTMGCFSFHPRKSITTGEGGMIVTDDEAIAQRIALLRTHGGMRGEYYLQFEEAGFNYRLSDIHAAVGLAQLEKLEWIVVERRSLAVQLTEMLHSIQGITCPVEPTGYFHTYQSYVVLLDETIDRDRVIAAMRKRDIETTLGTYALHAQPFFQRAYGYTPGNLPNSYKLFRQSLTLPLYPGMTKDDLECIVTTLSDSIAEVV
jgi:dTDP-4-amino-4,6-dideoxygalactose transaminase